MRAISEYEAATNSFLYLEITFKSLGYAIKYFTSKKGVGSEDGFES